MMSAAVTVLSKPRQNHYGDDLYAVKLTVKQFRDGGGALTVDGVEKLYKLYDAMLERRVPAAGSAHGEPAKGASSPTYPETAPPEGAEAIGLGDTIILRDLLRGIKGDDGEFLPQVVGGGVGGEARAAIELGDGLARLWVGPGADGTSLIHEHGHAFVEWLRWAAVRAEATDAAKNDWGTIRDWLGASD